MSRIIRFGTLVALFGLVVCSSAFAAPTGQLTQLAGKAGCWIEPSIVPLNGCSKAHGLGSPQTVVLSPDERNLYGSTNYSWGLVTFSRNKSTGQIKQTQCFEQAGNVAAGCTSARGLVWSFWATVSPDGKNVYASGGIGNAIAVFNRNATTGKLTQPAGPTGCIRNSSGGTSQGGPSAKASGCTLVENLIYPRTITVSPDGKFLYAAAFDGDSIVWFSRDPATGSLSQVAGGCITSSGKKGCSQASNLDAATDLAFTPDGKFLYATAFKGHAISAFSRDAASGALTQVSGSGGCLSAQGGTGCTKAAGLKGVYNLALSPDAKNLYGVSRNDAALTSFSRDAAGGGLTQLAGSAGCISSKSVSGCSKKARGLAGARGVRVSPDGKNVYTGSFSDSVLGVFARNKVSGSVSQLAGKPGCYANGNKPACVKGRALLQVWGMAIPKNGKFLYSGTGGDGNSGIAIFKRQS